MKMRLKAILKGPGGLPWLRTWMVFGLLVFLGLVFSLQSGAALEEGFELRLPALAIATLEQGAAKAPAAAQQKAPPAKKETQAVSPPRDPLIAALVANGRAVLGTAPIPVIRLGYTDGRFFRREGIPTAVYGPRVHRMGGPDEYVEQDEVLQVAQVHLATVLDYLGAR